MLEGWTTILVAGTVGLAAVVAVMHWVPAMIVKARQRAELIDRCRGKLALTYDDGPDKLLTPPLVDLLNRHCAKASFFLVGFRAERSPEMSDLLQQSGHELGCHTDMHRNSWRIWPWQAVRDVNDGYRRMKRWMRTDAPFRPPFGKLVTWTWLTSLRRGAPVSWWTHDGGDTWPVLPDPSVIAQEITSAPGAVVLLHSHDRGADRQAYVLALTERLLVAAKTRGWETCTVSELLVGPSERGGANDGNG